METRIGSSLEGFKDALFAFELDGLPEPLQIVKDALEKHFILQPECATTLVQAAGSVDEAAKQIDKFKARALGSAYALALINLTNFSSGAELEFLLSPGVLGNPRTVFLASLRGMQGDAYRFAREKTESEAQLVQESKLVGTHSCILNYSPANKDEKARITGELLAAYLREADARARAKNRPIPENQAFQALHILMKSETNFYGRKTSRFPIYPKPKQV